MVRFPVSTRMPCPNVEVAEVFWMSRVFARRPPAKVEVAFVPVTMSCCLNVVVPAMSAVDDAESAPPTLKFSVTVDEALETKPLLK